MERPLIATVTVVALVVLLSFVDLGLGTAGLWPVLVALAVGIASAPTIGRLSAFVIGIGAGWLGFALRAGFVPDLGAGRAIAIAVPVLVVGVIGIVSADRIPVWAGLAGIATFGAAYAPTYAADPTLFLTDSVMALAQTALAAGIGSLVGFIVGWLSGARVPDGARDPRRTIVLPDNEPATEMAPEGVR